MRLEELLKGVPLAGWTWNRDVEITGISYDTRTMAPGTSSRPCRGIGLTARTSYPRLWSGGRRRSSAAGRPTIPGPGW